MKMKAIKVIDVRQNSGPKNGRTGEEDCDEKSAVGYAGTGHADQYCFR